MMMATVMMMIVRMSGGEAGASSACAGLALESGLEGDRAVDADGCSARIPTQAAVFGGAPDAGDW